MEASVPETPLSKTLRPVLSAAIVLNRSPLLTQTPTTFERAFYSYQARLRRALHNPFPHAFYFPAGSLLKPRFNLEERERERIAFGRRYRPLTERAKEYIAADRAAVAQLSEQEVQLDGLQERVHQADLDRDHKSLDRKGRRNIYLLLLANSQGQEAWRFPEGGLQKGELLHQVRRILSLRAPR